jgi:hypothetical protein
MPGKTPLFSLKQPPGLKFKLTIDKLKKLCHPILAILAVYFQTSAFSY